MEDGYIGEGGSRTVSRSELDLSIMSERIHSAYSKANRMGEVVGRVTRYSPVTTSPGSIVEVEVDTVKYFSRGGVRIGDYLCIVDPKTLHIILGVVSTIKRADELALAGVDVPLTPNSSPGPTSPESILTSPIAGVRLLLEADPDSGLEPRPVSTPIEPQSPVFDPSPETLRYMLGLPGGGVLLGALSSLYGPVKGGSVAVRLPYKALLHHTLVIGTTGSGKTTLLKNMIASLTSEDGDFIVPIILDMNSDFIQLPIPSRGESDLEVLRSVRPPRKTVIVVPVSVDAASDALELDRNIYSGVAQLYHEDVLSQLVSSGGKWNCIERPEGVRCESDRLPFIIVPYFIDSVRRGNMPGESLSQLAPGMTRLSLELLRSLRERFYRYSGRAGYPPLYVLSSALSAYIEASRRNSEIEDVVSSSLESMSAFMVGLGGGSNLSQARVEPLGLGMRSLVDLVLEILSSIRPHRSTAEALYRKIQGLMDSGVVDVSIVENSRIRVLLEPSWRFIIELAADARAPVVVDLAWLASRSGSSVFAPRILGYRVLQSILRMRQDEWARRRVSKQLLIIIDEAHQFFPQERGGYEEQEASRQVASMISSMARLGRARGIGFVFSTHSPNDLHDIILQLSNTKIVLRTEKAHLEKLSIPADVKDAVPYLMDRYMIVTSFVFRGGYVLAATGKPVTMHTDFSSIYLRG
ncbi:ATP-binding protein [Aeropyrum pernix]|uniref:ATP-binding protein n=1 Tax=Aeropyrum pernix TaxID=56636 RepID=UPI0011E50EF6|nr:ATP-binding protein [Aeropyrum pernix]